MEKRSEKTGMHSKVIIVMPAYNAESTLERTLGDLPDDFADEIILVDDASRDNTVHIARKLGLTVFVHDENKGYGANQKTCYNEALKRGADIVIMIHPDYQYDSRLAPVFRELIEKDICDIVLGSRVRTRKECLGSGMPHYKYLANRFLTIVQNITTGQNLSEWHSGYRAYSRRVLEVIPYHQNSDDFVFDSQFLFQAVYFQFRIGDIPIPCRYMKEASSINFRRSTLYGIQTMITLFRFILQKSGFARFAIFQSAP
jgi:glycosyltransferase involved in cell wall biosynthesis